jgi:N-acetylneuraminic acid mutarotase
MKKKLLFSLLAVVVLSCKKEETPTPSSNTPPSVTVAPLGTWKNQGTFPGGCLMGASVLNFGSRVFMVGGGTAAYDKTLSKTNWVYFKQVWQFDGLNWVQKKNFPGKNVEQALGFMVDGKGYVVGGIGSTVYNEVWEYTPESDSWVQKKNAPFSGKAGGVSAVVNDKCYLGVGYNEKLKDGTDWWEYDPKTDNWTAKADFPGPARWSAVAFSVKGKIYAGWGAYEETPDKTMFLKDFYVFDPTTNQWQKLKDAPLDNEGRQWSSGFVLNDKIYTGGGAKADPSRPEYPYTVSSEFYEYNPATQEWRSLTPLPSGRTGHTMFSMSGVGFMVSGGANGFNSKEESLLKDVWNVTF